MPCSVSPAATASWRNSKRRNCSRRATTAVGTSATTRCCAPTSNWRWSRSTASPRRVTGIGAARRCSNGSTNRVPRQWHTPRPVDVGAGVARPAADGAEDAAVMIHCFGEFRIEAGGRAVALDALRPQARRVLQILALAPGRDHHREYLEDLLWPGVPHSRAAHRLQVAVSSVRRLLVGHGPSVDRRGEAYRLCLPASALSTSGRSPTPWRGRAGCRRAVTSPAAWRRAGRRSTVHRRPAAGTDRLSHVEHRAGPVAAQGCRECRGAGLGPPTLGEHDRALAAAERSVQLEPEQDTGWLVLADVHAELGDAGSAEWARREHARIRAEFGIPTLVGRGRSAAAGQIRPSRTA